LVPRGSSHHLSAPVNCSIVDSGLPTGWITAESLYTMGSSLLSPYSGNTYFYLPPVDGSQPWSFGPVNGGLAVTGSPFDPAPPTQPPSCPSYAFLQTMGNAVDSEMSALLTGLKDGVSYHVEFYYGVRSGSTVLGEQSNGAMSQSQLAIYYGSQLLWQSRANLLDAGGWIPVSTDTFTNMKTLSRLSFRVSANSTDDHSILITSVKVTSS